MRLSSLAPYTAVAALIALAGCASNARQALPLAVGTHVLAPREQAAPRAHLLYFDNFAEGAVDIFPLGGSNQQMVGQITGLAGASGLAVDAAGDLYVCVFKNAKVKVFSPGKSPLLLLTLNDSGSLPVNVAVDAISGDVAVANSYRDSTREGIIAFYHSGDTAPYKIVSSSNWVRMYFDAFDTAGNLYLSGLYASNNATAIGEITAGSSNIVDLPIAGSIAYPGPLEVDRQGNLLVTDQGSRQIDCFSAPSSFASCGTIALNKVRDPIGIALTNQDKQVYVADYGKTAAEEFAFPRGGLPISSVEVGVHQAGVAIAPAQH